MQRRRSQRLAAKGSPATETIPTVSSLVGAERPTLSGASTEVQQRILGHVLRDGGIGAAFQVARACRSLLFAFRGLPLWRQVAEKHDWKKRSKDLPFDEHLLVAKLEWDESSEELPSFDERSIVEKLQKLGRVHLCHNHLCLALTTAEYLVPTDDNVSSRFCEPCLRSLWDQNEWVRRQSFASRAWAEAERQAKSGKRLRSDDVSKLGLWKRDVAEIPYVIGYKGKEYAATEVLMKQWHAFGGQGGVDAKRYFDASAVRSRASALVPELLGHACGAIGCQIGWTGRHPILSEMAPDSDPAEAASAVVADLLSAEVAASFSAHPLHFPEVPFVIEKFKLNEGYRVWFDRQNRNFEAHADQDRFYSVLLEDLQKRCAGLGIDLRSFLVEELRSVRGSLIIVLPSDDRTAAMIRTALLEKEAGIADGKGELDGRIARAAKAFADLRTSPPDEKFAHLQADELLYLSDYECEAVNVEISRAVRRRVSEEVNRILRESHEAEWCNLDDVPEANEMMAAFPNREMLEFARSVVDADWLEFAGSVVDADWFDYWLVSEATKHARAILGLPAEDDKRGAADDVHAESERGYYCGKCRYFARKLTTYEVIRAHPCGVAFIEVGHRG
ncbi:hypothetical protein DFJ74DRAFT_764543 [Hyaloraphidium curvatum]|nr:hypothetical protein DFJ74DRAFT_764543 [Hyaloraphidium curvatum]